MVKCNICNNYFKRIDSVHLVAKHDITVNEYLIKFPGSEVISKDSVKKYSIAQKSYAKTNPDKMKLRAKQAKQTITPEQQKKTLDAMTKARFEKYNEIYGKDSLRNKKISDKTTQRWANYTEVEKTRITKQSAATTRKQLGEDLYLEMMAYKSNIGYQTLVKTGRGSKWEATMITQLKHMFPDTIAEYRVRGRYFDAYIPSKNLLDEFDGDFSHPLSLDECQYDFQIRNFYNDIKKNKIAT
jgi:hypothetical protein